MHAGSKKKKNKKISAENFDEIFDTGNDISHYLDFDRAIVVKRVNVDFPSWMIDMLDRQALKLNVSRQAIIKMWIHDRLRTMGTELSPWG